MSDHCKFVSTTQPRVLPGRHLDECEGDCAGCLTCPMLHCRICGVAHTENACPECLADVREGIAEIVERATGLALELHLGNARPATMSTVGRTADPEARGHLRASVAAGRVSVDYEGDVPRDKHGKEIPDRTALWVLGSWSMVYRDAFGHDEPVTEATIATEAGYLSRNLTEASSEPWVPFDQFAKDIRNCLTAIRNEQHDENCGEFANVDCFDCGGSLERRLTFQGFDDRWTCTLCRRRYTIAEYNFALRAKLEESA